MQNVQGAPKELFRPELYATLWQMMQKVMKWMPEMPHCY